LKKLLCVIIIIVFIFLIPTVLAYNLLGGRWSESDIENLGIYININNNPVLYEMLYAEMSWDSTQTPLDTYVTTYEWKAKVFAMLQYEEGAGWDGYAILRPSSSANPYSGAQTVLNLYYTQDYSFEKTQSVQAHEFGHVFGLAHETGSVLMNAYTNIRYDYYGVFAPQQDDVDGVNDIYG
jgi:hypothetical protein